MTTLCKFFIPFLFLGISSSRGSSSSRLGKTRKYDMNSKVRYEQYTTVAGMPIYLHTSLSYPFQPIIIHAPPLLNPAPANQKKQATAGNRIQSSPVRYIQRLPKNATFSPKPRYPNAMNADIIPTIRFFNPSSLHFPKLPATGTPTKETMHA
jgi:hypothetical protein